MKSSDVVKEYLEKYPDHPSLTIAKTIMKENPELYTTVDTCRTAIRRLRGALGDRQRKKLQDRRFIRELGTPNYNPFDFPESDEQELDPYVIPSGYKNVLILSDIHIPYHSIEALTAMTKWASSRKVDCIILNGDIVDFHKLSKFQKDPRKRDFYLEIQALEEFIIKLQEIFPLAKIYYKEGNHEYRLVSYLRVKAPELLGTDQFELPTLLKLGEKGVEYIKDKRIIKLDKLNVLHGHELKGGIIAPVNPARGIFLRTNTTAICGHWHRTSEHTESDLNGKMISCWSTGMLCEMHPEYMPYGKQNHGFAFVDINEGDFSVLNKRIYKGKVY